MKTVLPVACRSRVGKNSRIDFLLATFFTLASAGRRTSCVWCPLRLAVSVTAAPWLSNSACPAPYSLTWPCRIQHADTVFLFLIRVTWVLCCTVPTLSCWHHVSCSLMGDTSLGTMPFFPSNSPLDVVWFAAPSLWTTFGKHRESSIERSLEARGLSSSMRSLVRSSGLTCFLARQGYTLPSHRHVVSYERPIHMVESTKKRHPEPKSASPGLQCRE